MLFVLVIACNEDKLEDESANTQCELAIQEVDKAKLKFDAIEPAATEAFVTACKTYKNALGYQIFTCGDTNGKLKTIINDLGNCLGS